MDYTATFTELATQLTDAVADVAPIAIGVLGVLLGLSIAVKVFKRFAK